MLSCRRRSRVRSPAIFICYSWANAQATYALHRRLTRSGRETWIDIEKLDFNSDIKGQLDTAIRRSKMVLLVDSPEARASEWTRFERMRGQS
jgi:TIR domain